jgi:taurine dioxygenase
MNFKVQSISPSIGSIISGLNLSEPLAPHVLQELRKVWLQRKVLVFPKQSLTPQQQVDCTRQFGELDQYPFIEGIKGMPYVAEILKLPNEEINFGGVWHSDTSYLINPAAGASLYALEIPPIGGDTIFCNMGAAYQALTNDIKEREKYRT